MLKTLLSLHLTLLPLITVRFSKEKMASVSLGLPIRERLNLRLRKYVLLVAVPFPKKPDAPIAPGVSDIIEVKYDTERVGPIRKTITVASNASVPMVALKIKGEVVEQEPEE
jgi:hypothetical protein